MNRWTWATGISLILALVVLPIVALLLKITDHGWLQAIWLAVTISAFICAAMSERTQGEQITSRMIDHGEKVRGERSLAVWILLALLGLSLVLLALDGQISLWVGFGYFWALAVLGFSLPLLSRRFRQR